jgi:hypothetical protein
MKNRKTDNYLLNTTLVILLLYNILFFMARHLPNSEEIGLSQLTVLVRESVGMITFIEAIGVITLFVDLVGRFDSFQKPYKAIRIIAVSLLIIGLIFKVFINYLDSAYLDASIVEMILVV